MFKKIMYVLGYLIIALIVFVFSAVSIFMNSYIDATKKSVEKGDYADIVSEWGDFYNATPIYQTTNDDITFLLNELYVKDDKGDYQYYYHFMFANINEKKMDVTSKEDTTDYSRLVITFETPCYSEETLTADSELETPVLVGKENVWEYKLYFASYKSSSYLLNARVAVDGTIVEKGDGHIFSNNTIKNIQIYSADNEVILETGSDASWEDILVKDSTARTKESLEADENYEVGVSELFNKYFKKPQKLKVAIYLLIYTALWALLGFFLFRKKSKYHYRPKQSFAKKEPVVKEVDEPIQQNYHFDVSESLNPDKAEETSSQPNTEASSTETENTTKNE